MLPAWFVNAGKRLAKAPKIHMTDTGLAAHLLGIGTGRFDSDRGPFGPLLETFSVLEIVRQSAWNHVRAQAFHFRTSDGSGVDLALEEASGRVAGVEVKAAATVRAADFKGLRALAAAAGRRFHRGIVLYTGAQVVPFAPNLHAVPVEALWRWTNARRR